MTHERATNTLALIGRQGCDCIDVGGTQQRLTFRLEPARRHYGMAHQLMLSIGENMDAIGRDVSKKVLKIVFPMRHNADLNN